MHLLTEKIKFLAWILFILSGSNNPSVTRPWNYSFEAMVSQQLHYWYFAPNNALLWDVSCVYASMFSSIPGLDPLYAYSTPCGDN